VSNDPNEGGMGPLHFQEWGNGDPLIALHPLALESTAFAGVGRSLSSLGLRMLAADLPGFGKTPLVDGSLTPAALAKPVIELARSLERPPILMGMSMGGRVAIEVALTAPDAVRGLVLVAPYLPWRGNRRALALASYLNPDWAERLPLERIWPLLQHTTRLLESVPALENDWFARACVRVAYYSTCPATRVAFLSASRELALDPAYGEHGLWTRMPQLKMPVAFLWAGKDRLIPASHARDTAEVLPRAAQLEVACSGHFVNFLHFRCMERAITLATKRVLDAEAVNVTCADADGGAGHTITPCLGGSSRTAGEPDAKLLLSDAH
jgi:pimeloyl-ACP methyl ester carboxylesterase